MIIFKSSINVFGCSFSKIEIGHNFNLAHSGGLDGSNYTDHTCVMGNPLYSDDVGAMCYNAAKSWQLGWYDSNKISIDPRQGSWTGTIVGVADFANNPAGYPVVVRIATGNQFVQFIAFNRAIGVNSDNVQADNKVTVVEAGAYGEAYYQSWLKATLTSGEVYTMTNWADSRQDLTVTVHAINIDTGSAAGYAQVTVCLGPCVSPAPTTSPTNSPTSTPTIAPTPVPTRGPTAAPTPVPTSTPTMAPTASNFGPVHYVHMGPDIDGSETQGKFGSSVSVSKDGLRMVSSAPSEGSGKGVTRCFEWNANTSEWVQLGQNIVGFNPSDGLGWSTDMNEDGSRIILGAPLANGSDGIVRVYELDNTNTWQLMGNEIQPVAGSGGRAGTSVAMNALGDIVAFGAPYSHNFEGRVQAFKLVGSVWTPMGQIINPFDVYAFGGASIAITADGTRIVIGGEQGYYKGAVKIFDFDGSNWQENVAFFGDRYYDNFGVSVDISDDGSRVLVGIPLSDGTGRGRGVFNAGEFEVHEYNGSEWNVIGQQIIGSAARDLLGQSVSMSGDGSHIAVSSPNNDENGNNAGKVEVYQYSASANEWLARGQDIMGECEMDKFGEGVGSVALDASGNHLIVGSFKSNSSTGMVRAFEIKGGPWHSNVFSNDNCDRLR